jgi:hypothetical protein
MAMTGRRVIGSVIDDGVKAEPVIAIRSVGGLPVIVAAIGSGHAG